MSRRKRGLPPDTSPTPLNPQGNNSTRKCRTTQYNHVDVPSESGEIPQKETNCEQVNGEEKASQEEVGKETCGDVDEKILQLNGCVSEDLQDKGNAGSTTSLEPSKDSAKIGTNCSPRPVSEVRQVRERRIQRNQPASSTLPRPITRTTESRARAAAATAAARTTVTKAAINSVTSIQPDPPATNSAKHTAKGTNKGTSITKCTSPASRYSTHHSKGAAKDSSKDTTGDSTKDSSSTSKGSTKGLTETKTTTSAVKTRTSPRILLKR